MRIVAMIGASIVAGCGGTGPSTNEAYRVGYDIGLADECSRRGELKEPMPSAYDDSLNGGELASAFQSGYWTARGETNACR